MACTTQSKILAISSNPETIMLLLIVGELWDPEVLHHQLSQQELSWLGTEIVNIVVHFELKGGMWTNCVFCRYVL